TFRPRLTGQRCPQSEPGQVVMTMGSHVCYPDTLVTYKSFAQGEQLAPGVVVDFEVLSPTTGRRDRIDKVREYASVPSILRYVIVESVGPGLQVLHRESCNLPWEADAVTEDENLLLPEIGLEIPVSEFYDGVEFD